MNYSNRIIELFETGQIPERVRIGSYNLEEHSCARYFETEPPETRYLAQDYIPLGVAGTLTGKGGTGKSYLGLDFAERVAAAPDFSVKWLDSFKINTGGVVVYVSAEEPEPVIHNRVYWLTWNLAKELNKPFKEVYQSVTKRLFIMNVWGKVKPLFEKADKGIAPTDEYWKLCYTFEKCHPVLVVFDTKSRFSGGAGDENDNAAAAREVTYYESIAYTTGATVLILHHVNKASYNSSGNLYGSARGGSAFQDSLRFGLTLQHVDAENGEQVIRVVNTKQNYSKLQTDIFLRRNQYQGFELASDPKTLSKKVQKDEDLEILKTFLFTNPGSTKKDIALALQGTKGKPGLLPYHRARAALSLGMNLGILEKVEENDREIIRISPDPIPPKAPVPDEELEDLPPSANTSEASEPSDGKNGRELVNPDAASITPPIMNEELVDGPPSTKPSTNKSTSDYHDEDFLDG